MKKASQWFAEYGVSHQNPTNKLVHFICVPAIFWSIIGLLAVVKLPFLEAFVPANYAHLGTLLITITLIFYMSISFSIFIGMTVITILCLQLCTIIEQSGISLLWLSLTVFILAWVGQFWGHKIEGAKPSFFKDIQFLLVGPAWIMGFIYKKLGIPFR